PPRKWSAAKDSPAAKSANLTYGVGSDPPDTTAPGSLEPSSTPPAEPTPTSGTGQPRRCRGPGPLRDWADTPSDGPTTSTTPASDTPPGTSADSTSNPMVATDPP